MPQITETLAGRYADAVLNVLAEHFPDLRDGNLRQGIHNDVARQATEPDHWFERIITFTREWRLHPGDVYATRWRVHLVPHKDVLTDADKALVDVINRKLGAIRVEA